MEAMVAHLTERVLPDEPLRQWTVSFPFALRRLLAADAELLSAVHRSFVRLVFLTLRSKAEVPRGRAGAVSLIQRFDSSLGLDPHVHLCALDGVYARREDGTLEFFDTGAPTASEVETVALRLHRAIGGILRRRGLLTREGDLAPRESQETTPLERLYEAAARDFIASGTLDARGEPRVRPRAPLATQRLGPLLVDVDGINVHADLRIEKGDRQGRERLLRYGLRPPFADEQIQLTGDGRIAFALRKARKNGDTHRFFTPLQFLRRLAWLCAPPRQALVRYEGVLAPAAPWRSSVVPAPASTNGDPVLVSLPDGEPPRNGRSPAGAARRWAALLRRVYDVDALLCPKSGCGGRMRVVGAITSPVVIRRILEHLGLPAELPTFSPARGPPPSAFSGFD